MMFCSLAYTIDSTASARLSHSKVHFGRLNLHVFVEKSPPQHCCVCFSRLDLQSDSAQLASFRPEKLTQNLEKAQKG
jgi:hypothetical protein